ncbi:MAG: hypothetical protein QW607_04410 [Desulfurococcaceae archaeon]
MSKFKIKLFSGKKRKKKEPLPEEREKFIRIYAKFLETLVSTFYPVRLEWFEVISMIVAGILFGLGIGWFIKHLVFR